MNSMGAIKDEVRSEIAKILELEESEINDQAHFFEVLGMDSLQALELLVTLEKRYKITIPQEGLRQFINVSSVVEALQTFMAEAQAAYAS